MFQCGGVGSCVLITKRRFDGTESQISGTSGGPATLVRPNNAQFAALYAMVAPNYGAVIESYTKAQQAAKEEQAVAA